MEDLKRLEVILRVDLVPGIEEVATRGGETCKYLMSCNRLEYALAYWVAEQRDRENCVPLLAGGHEHRMLSWLADAQSCTRLSDGQIMTGIKTGLYDINAALLNARHEDAEFKK